MVDPLADVVALLRPAARFSKQVLGAGQWRIRRSDAGQPFYCAVLEGSCQIALDDQAAVLLQAGDFVLVPAAHTVGMASADAPPGNVLSTPVAAGDGRFRIGEPEGQPDLRILAGHCTFESPDASLLVSLLPRLIHVRDEPRLAMLVQLLGDESRQRRPARDVVLQHLLEVLLIEALRSPGERSAVSPGLAQGLADPRLSVAIRALHADPTRPWTVAAMAKEAALSRSTFFARFQAKVGMPPMEYLLAWRMALAKDLLRRREGAVSEIAARVGYGSASTFSVAFTRHVGRSPTKFARENPAAARA
ncbi:MAG TPA: AraC family transcriptional regulator [Ramlibacter sp.]|nr:AraC family transcriptional regulator [Ramlibacter sp.]